MSWYTKSAQEVAQELNTDAKSGITESGAKTRADKYGANSREDRRPKKIDPAIWRTSLILPAVVFFAAAVCYGATKNYAAAISILAAAGISVGAQFLMLTRAGNLIESIDRVSAPVTTVVRDGVRRVIDSTLLVPGDVVVLKSGDLIAADMRVIESLELVVDESPLPGGFISARKNASDILEEETEIAAHTTMCYAGCTVVSGTGRAIVVEIGDKVACPQAKAAAKYAYGTAPDTKLFLRQSRRLAWVGFALSMLALAVGLLKQEMARETLVSTILTCCTLAAAVVPAGLCLVQTGLMANAMARLARRGAVIKSLNAMEDLNRVDSLVLPKTGVITSDEMTATLLWSGGEYYDITGRGWLPEGDFVDADGKTVDISRRRDAALTLIAASLCANSDIEEQSAGSWVRRGDPTECALVTMAAKAGLFRADMQEMFPKVIEIPFDPIRRRMTTIHRRGRMAVAYTKGAPETVLAASDTISVSGRAIDLTDENREQIAEIYNRLTEQGLRVVAVAYRELGVCEEDTAFDASTEENLIFLGLVGIENRVAHTSVSAFNLCESANIKTLMVSGDEMGTTSDAALGLGIHEAILDGAQISDISAAELASRLRQTRACARVTPSGRRAIVSAQKANGGFVAAAGTMAADAAAVRAADVGFALGASSAEATREAASVILDEPTFSEVTRVIEHSRRCFSALRAYAIFAMSTGIAAILAVLICYLAGLSVPFSAVHLVWLHAIIALIPTFALRDESGERSTMRAAARAEGETVINFKTIVCAAAQAVVPLGLLFAAYGIASARGTAAGADDLTGYIRTACFVSFALSMLALAFTARSEHTSLIRLGFASNRGMLAVIGGTAAVLILGVYVPFLQNVFATVAIGWVEWLVAVAFAAVTLVWGEVFKRTLRPIVDRMIKITPKTTSRRRRIEFGEGFFSKFENADPTQDETLDEKPVETPVEEPVEVADEPQPIEDEAETEEIVEADAAEQVAPEDAAESEEPMEAAEEITPEETAAEDEPIEAFMSAVPEELKIYGDLFAALPKEILESGLEPTAGEAEPIELPVEVTVDETIEAVDEILAETTSAGEEAVEEMPVEPEKEE